MEMKHGGKREGAGRKKGKGPSRTLVAIRLSEVQRDKAGEIVEGNPKEVKPQKDVWTFGRIMGSDNPNWQLVATGE